MLLLGLLDYFIALNQSFSYHNACCLRVLQFRLACKQGSLL